MRVPPLLLLPFVACKPTVPLPADLPWQPGGFECPLDIPEQPQLDPSDWTPSEAPTGGDIIIFNAMASAPDRVYAGSGQNGVFRSDDNGLSWVDVTGPVTHVYGQVAVGGADAELLAYTSGQGICSDDAGEHWANIDLPPPGGGAQGLVYMGSRLFVATGEGQVAAFDSCGGIGMPRAFLPLRPGVGGPSSGHSHGVLSSQIWLAANDTILYAMKDSGDLFASPDQGFTWIEQLDDSAWLNVTFRADADYLWVIRQNATTFDVQRRSATTDPTVAFETVATLSGTASGAFLTGGGEYLVSANFGLWSSESGEIVVDAEDNGLGMYSVGRAGSTLLSGYRNGVSASPDNGASWGWTSDEMIDLDIVNARVHPTCPNVVFSGTQCRTGTFRSEDWGMTWTRVTADMHYTMGVAVTASAPENIWAVTDDQVYLSSDMGDTWKQRYPKGYGLPGAHYHGLGVSPDRPATVLVGSVGSGEYGDDTARIYRTDNMGATWSRSSTGLPASEQSFHVVHFSEQVPGTVLLGTYRTGLGISHGGDGTGIGVFRSVDMGKTWAQLTGTSALSFSHMAECDGRIYAATELGVIVTANMGDTWEVLLAAAPESEVLNIACAGDRLLAVDPAAGIFRSDDSGATWTDWTGSITFDLQQWETQLGLELAPDGSLAWFTHPGEGVFLRPWE